MVDDAVVEIIARNTYARMAEWLGSNFSILQFEAQHGIVRRATTEIRDDNCGTMFEALCVIEGGRHGFIDEVDFFETDCFERVSIAQCREVFVGRGAGETHGTSDHKSLRQGDCMKFGMCEQVSQEDG